MAKPSLRVLCLLLVLFRAKRLAFEPGSPLPLLPFLILLSLGSHGNIIGPLLLFGCHASSDLLLAFIPLLLALDLFVLCTLDCFLQLRYIVLDFCALHPCACLVPLVLLLDRFAFVG